MVEKYLASLHGQYPIKYLKAEDLYKKIPPTRYSDEYLFDKACDIFNAGHYLRALKVFNHLIYRAETPYKVCLAKYFKGLTLEKLLLYDEALNSYKQALFEFNRLDEDEKLTSVDLGCYFQIGRINSVTKKTSFITMKFSNVFAIMFVL